MKNLNNFHDGRILSIKDIQFINDCSYSRAKRLRDAIKKDFCIAVVTYYHYKKYFFMI